MKYCDQCGAKLRDAAKFCSECGSKLEEMTVDKEVINHNDIVKKIVSEVNVAKGKCCCWEIYENIILYDFWQGSFLVMDLRNPAVAIAMECHEKDYIEIMEHWLTYMKGMEDYQVHIYSPIWISNAFNKKFFYIDYNMHFHECTFEFKGYSISNEERWENVQYLQGPNKELRILASDNEGELTAEFYLFNKEGTVLWKADRPVRLDGYYRKIGHEFSCNEEYFSNNQMVVDFNTGEIVMKDAFAVLFYKEKESNKFVIDCLKKLDGYDNYQHEVYAFDNGTLGPVKEVFKSKKTHLPDDKYDIYRECDFQTYQMYPSFEDLKKAIKQDFF